jgi:hypothetical protein
MDTGVAAMLFYFFYKVDIQPLLEAVLIVYDYNGSDKDER